MRFRRMKAAILAVVLAVIFSGSAGAEELQEVVQMIPASVDMETDLASEEGPGSLYSLSAVLMDAASGRVLYAKDGNTARPNASTTKVLTCILALENAPGDDYVTVSANAAAQPDVQLNIREGEQYYLEDLLYSMMLKSHNDVAVAVAEHIGGTVEHFAEMMNEKAQEIGCTDTHFVTPNGLDATDKGGEHHTTARDLALIMRYAIRNKTFLRITQTRDYSFSDIKGNRQFSIHNANAFLDMEEGVLSGKTGFTGNAGYCYVCACESEGRTFIISLLGCGWPNNKTYKWSDTRKLLQYGEENYHYQSIWQEPELPEIPVENGVSDFRSADTKRADEENTEKGVKNSTEKVTEKDASNGTKTGMKGVTAPVSVKGVCKAGDVVKNGKLLLKDTEQVTWKTELPDSLEAPVKEGQQIGTYSAVLNGQTILKYPILADRSVQKISYAWCADEVFYRFFHG